VYFVVLNPYNVMKIVIMYINNYNKTTVNLFLVDLRVDSAS